MQSRDKIENFRKNLPIHEYKQKIINTIINNDVCIVTGDTGSGKSTQLPQYMLDCPEIKKSIISKQNQIQEYSKGKISSISDINVIITQPRRMAAVGMANRVSYERGGLVGQQVGYMIRFDDKSSINTHLRYITDGIFVRQCIHDPYLFKYQVVILDEAHERSLHTDILFALLKQAVRYRKGTLKLIVTSATLNIRTFSSYYGNCPVIQMHGKLFPVEVKYYPIHHHSKVEQSVKAAIRMHLHEGPGDILVFLTGSEECQSATRLCQEKLEELMSKGRDVPGMIIYQLYGALSNEEQIRVFEKTPEGIRKVVFSTNIAETSLTIDNIGFVIDCGFAKQKNYNPKTNMDSLITVPISKVQAIQRKGRAGRTQEGRCLRLYTQKFYQQMKDYSLPQILRVSLSSVILTLKSMKIKDVINFDYIESPDKQSILKALRDLFLLSALDENGKITELGIEMSKFPLDPQFAKSIITSVFFQVQQQMITLVSMLSTESIWKKVLRINEEQYSLFLQKQNQFLALTGDHQTYLNIYKEWMECQNADKFCNENFLNFRALKQTDSIRIQLEEILQNNCNIRECAKLYKKDPNYIEFLEIKAHYKKLPKGYVKTLLRKCLAISFYFNTARLSVNGQVYILNYPSGTVVSIDPTSALALQGLDSPAVLFTQLSGGSSRGIMRIVSIIDDKWIQCYLVRTTQVDSFQLAGMQFNCTRKFKNKPEQSEEIRKERQIKQRQQKIQKAIQRYQLRKKIKLE